MGKTVLGSLSSFARQIQIVEKDIESRVGGRNTTFPGTLSLDDLLARVQALEGSGQGGALSVKRDAPLYDVEDPAAGHSSRASSLAHPAFCVPAAFTVALLVTCCGCAPLLSLALTLAQWHSCLQAFVSVHVTCRPRS